MANNIDEVLVRIRADSLCAVYPPREVPAIQTHLKLPEDLKRFYSLCGGLKLFENSNYSFEIISPELLIPSNIKILGQQYIEDASSSWYIVASSGQDQFISIDLSEAKNGRCYDSFMDAHAVVGSCAIVANTFTNLLVGLYNIKGDYLYWLKPEFKKLGDAYD